MVLKTLQNIQRDAKTNLFGALYLIARYTYTKWFKQKAIFMSFNSKFVNLKNAQINGMLKVGLDSVGFSVNDDLTLINLKGILEINGTCSIAKGTRLDIGSKAKVTIGDQSYINPRCTIVIMHNLVVGNKCAISWNCNILDEDFHEIMYQGKKNDISKSIEIGNHVWIGSNCSIYKGSKIADGCVVAANSIVRGVFSEENCLIMGSPAKIVKRNINWK